MRLFSVTLGVLSWAVLCAACDGGGGRPPERVLFHFSMLGDATGLQDFRAITSDPQVIAAARVQLGRPIQERHLFIIGTIDRGNGGHKLDWNLHFLPDQWDLTGAAIELCDGNAVIVSQAVDYWVDTVGQFCPWGARLAAEVAGTH